MKVLLKIGYHSFLLPSDQGIQTIVKAFSQAVECCDLTYKQDDPHIEAQRSPPEITVRYLAKHERIVPEPERHESKQLRLIAPTAIIIPPQ